MTMIRPVPADAGRDKAKHAAEEFHAIWRRRKALPRGRFRQAFHFAFPPSFSAKLQVQYCIRTGIYIVV